ncbi:phage tail protein [Brevibacillus migulae]|uniref:phage tail protein n=1 Tax=Brevibacillus migulae TaxID=1644114 RepID=UPI00106DE0D2|nr:tail fiber protein [Brevibacillus migulae]
MSEPFLGEIQMFPYGFVPRGWAPCDGSLMPINQNQPLFALLGTTYGGDGMTTFALPDLRGRVPVHVGEGITLGQAGGEENHQLNVQEMPMHTHTARASEAAATTKVAAGNSWAKTSTHVYAAGANGQMSSSAIAPTGSGQAHANMQPYTVFRFCIAIQGIFPSRD